MNMEISIDKMPSSYKNDNVLNDDIEYCHKVIEILVNEDRLLGYPIDCSFIFDNFNENDPLVKEYEKTPSGSYSHDGFVSEFKLSSKDAVWF